MSKATEIRALQGLLEFLNKQYRVPRMVGAKEVPKEETPKETPSEEPQVEAPQETGEKPAVMIAMSRVSKKKDIKQQLEKARQENKKLKGK